MLTRRKCLLQENYGFKKREAEGVVRLPRAEQTRKDSGADRAAGHSAPSHNIVAAPLTPLPQPATEYTRIDPNPRVGDPERVFNAQLKDIFNKVVATGRYNYASAHRRVPSGLNIGAWRRCLVDYADGGITDYLAYGWPVNHDRVTPLQPTPTNHPSALNRPDDVNTLHRGRNDPSGPRGPFRGPPVNNLHVSPLMTKPKRDSKYRRVIMDLSWPRGMAVNDGIDESYIDGPATVTLPTTDYMAERILTLGPGAHMYKTDLARGYRQLRVDPWDWPLLGFKHNDRYFMDICPPFGLRTSAMFMQRTSQAICYIHQRRGFLSRAYLDDFGGGRAVARQGRGSLTCPPDYHGGIGRRRSCLQSVYPLAADDMAGDHLRHGSNDHVYTPRQDAGDNGYPRYVGGGRLRATYREVQSLLGLLHFVASVSPPVRVYTNRMLLNLREMPRTGGSSLSLGYKRDLAFFLRLLPAHNGIRILDKASVPCQEFLELDACLTGCGATTREQYYAETFPDSVLEGGHLIAHLELLYVVVATKVWQDQWSGRKVKVSCDNTNACLAIQTGRSRDSFMQACIRELFFVTASQNIELWAIHCPGKDLGCADALSRMHTGEQYREIVRTDEVLGKAKRVGVPPQHFRLTFDP